MITFSSDVRAATTTANLSTINSYLASVCATSKGYFCGGSSGTISSLTVVDILTFSTDTTAASTNALVSNRKEAAGLSNGSSKGYMSGGRSDVAGDYTVNTQCVTFSTSAWASVTTANMSHYSAYLAGLSDGGINGFWTGGLYGGVKQSATDMIVFSTEITAAKTTADLIAGRSYLTGVGDMGY
jgi:hypothetical protein